MSAAPDLPTAAWDRPHPFVRPVAPQPQDIDGLEHTNNAIYLQ